MDKPIILIALFALISLFFISNVISKKRGRPRGLFSLIFTLFLIVGVVIAVIKLRLGVIPSVLALVISLFLMVSVLRKIRKGSKKYRTGRRSSGSSSGYSSSPKHRSITHSDVSRIVHQCCTNAILANYSVKITSDCVWVDVYFKPNWTVGVMSTCVNDISYSISQEFGIRAEVEGHY